MSGCPGIHYVLCQKSLFTIRWISHASAGFIGILATQQTNELGNAGRLICSETLRTGPRNIAVLPTYLTYLVLRRYWLEMEMSLLLIHRLFHGSQYHIKCALLPVVY